MIEPLDLHNAQEDFEKDKSSYEKLEYLLKATRTALNKGFNVAFRVTPTFFDIFACWSEEQFKTDLNDWAASGSYRAISIGTSFKTGPRG